MAECEAIVGAKPWDDVLSLGLELMAELGWDTRLLNLVGQSLLHRHGMEGWRLGVRVWEEALGPGWEALGPRRAGAKAGGVNRYMEALNSWILAQPMDEANPASTLVEGLEGVRRLRAACGAREIGDELLLGRALEHLESALKSRTVVEPTWTVPPAARAPEAESEEHVVSPPPLNDAHALPQVSEPALNPALGAGRQASSSLASPTPASNTVVIPYSQSSPVVMAADANATPAQVRALFDAQREGVLKLLSQLRASDPSSPAPYRIARDWAWAQQGMPPRHEGRPRRVGFTLAELRWPRQLQDRLAGGDWDAALRSAEHIWPKALLWLDPHHVTSLALRALGYVHAAVEVEAAVLNLTRRLPELEALEYNDGTPFARAETRAWLESLRAPHSPAAPTPSTQPAGSEHEPGPLATAFDSMADALARCASALRAGRPRDAAAVLAACLAQTSAGRDRFVLKVRFAALLMDHGHLQAAGPLLLELDELARAHNLQCWEPSLEAELLGGLLRMAAMDRTTLPEASAPIRRRAARLGALHLLLE